MRLRKRGSTRSRRVPALFEIGEPRRRETGKKRKGGCPNTQNKTKNRLCTGRKKKKEQVKKFRGPGTRKEHRQVRETESFFRGKGPEVIVQTTFSAARQIQRESVLPSEKV